MGKPLLHRLTGLGWLALGWGLCLNLQAADTYSSDFSGWRDQRTNYGFNAMIERDGTKAKISIPAEFSYGKVMSPEEGVTLKMTPALTLSVTVDEIDEGSALAVEVMSAGPPYDAYKVISGISKPGTYTASIARVTRWSTTKTFWVTFWLEGSGKKTTLSQLKISEAAPAPAAPAANTLTAKAATIPLTMAAARTVANAAKATPLVRPVTAAPAPAAPVAPAAATQTDGGNDPGNAENPNFAYFENWSRGLNGWRDGALEKGANSVAEVKKGGRVKITLAEKATYGKFGSKGIFINLDETPYLEVDLERELEHGTVKVQLVQERNTKNYFNVIPNFSRPGIYSVNIPEVTGWKGSHLLLIAIWLEGEGTEVSFNSIGFTGKRSTVQSIQVPILSLSNAELLPGKRDDLFKIAGAADQSFRSQYLGDYALDPAWDAVDRYGNNLKSIGVQNSTVYSEISQKLYLITQINPSRDFQIYASLGYDLSNAYVDTRWESSYARSIPAKFDYSLLHYKDLYFGNACQVGSVYDPVFTDLTLKKASTTPALIWKPTIGDYNFKVFATRLYSEGVDYRNDIYLTGVRGFRNLDVGAGTFQVGLSAANLSKTNGTLNSSLQGSVDPAVYENFLPSVYVRFTNTGNNRVYYRGNPGYEVNSVSIVGNITVNVSINPATDANLLYAQSKADFDGANNARGIGPGGYITYRLPLKNGNTIMDPATIIGGSGSFMMAGDPAGSIETEVSSDGMTWLPLGSFLADSTVGGAHVLPFAPIVADLRSGTFDSTQGTTGRSLLSADLHGQLYSVSIDTEFATSLSHNQDYLGDRSTQQSNAFYLTLSRGFSGAYLKASYFNMPAEYSTSLGGYDAVDDNDTRTYLPDNHLDKKGVVFNDNLNRGVPDREWVVGLFIPQDYLVQERDDLNHNGIMDARENDHEPDYPFRRNQRGLTFSATLPRQFIQDALKLYNVELKVDAMAINRLSQPGKNYTLDANLNYHNTDIDNLELTAGVYAARIKDELSDQYSLYNASDQAIQLNNSYLNNFVFTPEVMARYDAPWGLKATLLDRFRVNRKLDRADGYQYNGNETVADVRYKKYWVDSFATTPVYVGAFGLQQANADSPVYNTYYLPTPFAAGVSSEDWDTTISHSFYLQNSYLLMSEYQLAMDFGRELWGWAKQGMATQIRDRIGMGVMRNIPRGYIRIQYELNKYYYPYNNAVNWGQATVWAQMTLTF